MIKTKLVVGDVLLVDGKQEVVRCVEVYQYAIDKVDVSYYISNHKWYEESELV